jgi:hypothetical protein
MKSKILIVVNPNPDNPIPKQLLDAKVQVVSVNDLEKTIGDLGDLNINGQEYDMPNIQDLKYELKAPEIDNNLLKEEHLMLKDTPNKNNLRKQSDYSIKPKHSRCPSNNSTKNYMNGSYFRRKK